MDILQALERLLQTQEKSLPSAAEYLADLGTPSASVAVLDGGKIISNCFSNLSDDEATLFQACSISKPIAGLATMRLVAQGRLKLDSRIVDVLPANIVDAISSGTTRHLAEKITIRHLLSHTSGLNVSHFRGYVDNKLPNTLDTLHGKLPAGNLPVRVQGIPGHAFSYSGGGFTVLQCLLEHVSGRKFDQLVKELVLDPLSMTDSTYHMSPDGQRYARCHYTGYKDCEFPWNTMTELAAAGLWSTPQDLLKAVHAIQLSVEGESGSFLPQDLAKELLTEVNMGMALSWIVAKGPGIAFGHSGYNDPGWTCVVMGYEDLTWGSGGDQRSIQRASVPKEAGISVMTNSLAGDAAIYKIVDAIAYIKGWPRLPRQGGYQMVTIPLRDRSASIDPTWTQWIGMWSSGWSLGRHEEDGSPIIQRDGLAIHLVPAASPVVTGTINLVLDGLEMNVVLTRSDGDDAIELYNGGMGTVEVLKREQA